MEEGEVVGVDPDDGEFGVVGVHDGYLFEDLDEFVAFGVFVVGEGDAEGGGFGWKDLQTLLS